MMLTHYPKILPWADFLLASISLSLFFFSHLLKIEIIPLSTSPWREWFHPLIVTDWSFLLIRGKIFFLVHHYLTFIKFSVNDIRRTADLKGVFFGQWLSNTARTSLWKTHKWSFHGALESLPLSLPLQLTLTLKTGNQLFIGHFLQ